MRITCPTCSTQYDVDESDIAVTGQDVQCTECMTIWTQARSGEATNPRSAGEIAGDSEETFVEQGETSAEKTPDIADLSSYFDELDEIAGDSEETLVEQDETSAEETPDIADLS
ncbi:MAG: zinc-ribbon domain-containing protein, partial [Rhodobacteraceae bacterium]|nr:zinc-ribbon domain-containing protein [Paracoccaceae bacterium]